MRGFGFVPLRHKKSICGAGVQYLKSPALATLLHQSLTHWHSPSTNPPRSILCRDCNTMRFPSNALIVSTLALLSLITLVVNADSDLPTKVTAPAAGVTLNAYQMVDVKWYVAKGENPSRLVVS